MSVIFNQEIIMLLLIILGVFCYKFGLISENGRKDLSSLVLIIVNPIVIFMAYQKKFEIELLNGLLISLLLSAVSYIIAITVSYMMLQKKTGRETDIERFSSIYSNCGFMGIPLVNALFGSEGVFYLTAFITVFNLLVWTHGVMQISGAVNFKSIKKAFLSPSILAIVTGLIFFIARIHIPVMIYNTLDYIADMNTPLAMIAAGATIAEADILHAFRNKYIYIVTTIKLIIIPVLLLAVFNLFPVDKIIKLTVITAMAAPSATMCTLFCIKYDKNSYYASEIFAVTTLLSTATLPLIMLFDKL